MAEARLDVALVQRGLAPSRERAQEAIGAGMVLLNGKPGTKASQKVTESDRLEVTGDPIGYVGRGGLKLEGALDHFAIDPAGLVCLDVGASTGGFTDCLLRRGARLVYAVDVGRDQLHPDLRRDERVVNLEGTDIRTVVTLPSPPELASIDVSFISLTLVLPALAPLLKAGGDLLLLVKPQFELQPGQIGKGGIVTDARLYEAVEQRIRESCAQASLQVRGWFDSPIQGGDGNREFFVHATTVAKGQTP